jgi:hypothetical protein
MKFAKYKQRMLKRNWPMKSFHDVDHSPFSSSNPVCKLHIIWYCRTQHDNTNVFRKHDNSLFPDDSSFLIVYVMHLIKYDPLNISYHFSSSIQIISQNFGCHDNARCLWIQGNISSYNSDRFKLLTQLTILLITQCLNRRSVDNFSFVFIS